MHLVQRLFTHVMDALFPVPKRVKFDEQILPYTQFPLAGRRLRHLSYCSSWKYEEESKFLIVYAPLAARICGVQKDKVELLEKLPCT